MKVHQFTRGFWEHEPSLSLGCNKRLRSLVPNLSNNTDNITTTTTPNSFDLKSFIRPECSFRNLSSSEDNKKDPASPQGQAETQPGGTRWNPTQEQIGILEMLYKSGMRTPNAQQIEQITVQLSKYGKIEGKNVFYWFQNHKARERQKQKRNSLGFVHSSPRTTTTVSSTFSTTPTTTLETPKRGEVMKIRDQGNSPLKKCRSWPLEYLEDQSWLMFKEEEQHKTLELFPLHPESR